MGNLLSGRLGTAVLVGALLCAVSGTLGCKKLFKKKDAGAGTGTSTTSPGGPGSAQDDADEQLTRKLDEYIDCLNSLSSSAHRSRSRYFQWVPKTGPTGNERFPLGIHEIAKGEAEDCAAGVAKAKLMTPSEPKLEAAGDEFAAAIVGLDALVDDAHVYYENKNFRDDKFAKGKALHPQLMAAFAKFSKADTNLHSTLDGITKPLAHRSLGRIEREEGKKFRYHRKATLIAARELVEAGDPVGDDDDIDFALFGAAFTEFDNALTGLETYGVVNRKDLDSQANPAWPLAASHMDSFVRAANDYRKKAREYSRCLRDAPARAKTPAGKIDLEKMPPCPDGRPRDVVSRYNAFIKTSNANQFP